MSSHPSCALVLAAASLVLAACTGEAAEPTPTTLSLAPSASTSSATPPTSPTSSPSPAAPSATPTPAPAAPSATPTPAPVVAGAGEVVVTADDGTFVTSRVAGTCLLAGSDLPPSGAGPALGTDVETFVAVDNFLGPLGEPVAPADLAITVDGTDGSADADLVGGPARWSWWRGEVGDAVLADPVDDDGVTVSTLSLTAALSRAPREQSSVRAPRPPVPSSGPSDAPATPSPSATPAGAAPAPIAPRPQPDVAATTVRQPASPDPTTGPPEPSPSPSSSPTPGVTPPANAPPSPSPSPGAAATPVATLTIDLVMTCTLVP